MPFEHFIKLCFIKMVKVRIHQTLMKSTVPVDANIIILINM